MFLPSRTTWRIVIGAMLLTIFCCFRTETAKASCGDWLADHSTHSTPKADAVDEDVPEAPCRCQGPECRNLPENPLPTSPDRRFSSERAEWGTLLAKLEFDPPLSSPRLIEGAILMPQGQMLRIERPPRG